jgi:hypothetical protein
MKVLSSVFKKERDKVLVSNYYIAMMFIHQDIIKKRY